MDEQSGETEEEEVSDGRRNRSENGGTGTRMRSTKR